MDEDVIPTSPEGIDAEMDILIEEAHSLRARAADGRAARRALKVRARATRVASAAL